jgi:hypothetical protein
MTSSFLRRSAGVAALSLAASMFGPVAGVLASSHREAPLISMDPAADGTDLYAFISPTDSSKVVIVDNSNPLGIPGAGPNYFNFATDVVYAVHVDNDGDAKPNITYAFTFERFVKNSNSFLYNLKPYSVLDDGNVTYKATVYLIKGKFGGKSDLSKKNLLTTFTVAPPAIGPKSQPNYASLAQQAIHDAGTKGKFFAGPRDDPFYGDLRVFDLLDLGRAKDSLAGTNVQSIVFEVPASSLTGDGRAPAQSGDPVIGVWTANYRYATRVLKNDGTIKNAGSLVQVSRLGMPLVNEVVVPLAYKDYFNASAPQKDADTKAYADVVLKPELAGLFKAVLGLDVPLDNRTDLVTVFLTGVPGLNQPKNVRPAEMLRINLSTPVAASPNRLGVFGGDTAGFPNGRRLADDTIDISVQAVAGTLVDPKYANPALGDGVHTNDVPFLSSFPYVAGPHLLPN